MRKTVPMSIGEIWGEFVSSTPAVARRLTEARIPDIWPAVVGPLFAAHTSSLRFEKGILYVKMNSSAARNELFMRREELKNSINTALEMRVVNSVIVK